MVTRWLASTSLVRFPTINWRSGVNGVNGAGTISHLFSFCVFTCSPGSWWFFRGKSTGKIHMVPVKNCVPKKIPGVFFCHIRISQKISHPTTSHNMIVSLYVSHYISLWKPLRIVYPIFSHDIRLSIRLSSTAWASPMALDLGTTTKKPPKNPQNGDQRWEIPMKIMKHMGNPMVNPMGTSSFNEEIHFFGVENPSSRGMAYHGDVLLNESHPATPCGPKGMDH